jgi:hypothetical protein
MVAAGTFELALVALLQLRQLQLQQRAQEEAEFRPVLIPEGLVPPESLWQGPEFQLQLRNVGRGLATNVEAILLPPIARRTVLPPMFHAVVRRPITPGYPEEITLRQGGYMVAEDDMISGIPMAVPPERRPEDGLPDPHRTQPRCIARMSITCTDLFGVKHASIFDWQESGGWLAVKLVNHADGQIEDIDNRRRSRKTSGQHDAA